MLFLIDADGLAGTVGQPQAVLTLLIVSAAILAVEGLDGPAVVLDAAQCAGNIEAVSAGNLRNLEIVDREITAFRVGTGFVGIFLALENQRGVVV